MHIAGFALHNLMKIFSQFDHLFMACLVVLHVPATFAPARGKLTSLPLPPPPRLRREGEHKKRGGVDAMVHGTIASTQVSTHSSHPLRYPFTYLRKLRDWGGGGVLHALRGGRRVLGVATTGG